VGRTVLYSRDVWHCRPPPVFGDNVNMKSGAVVLIEELDSEGHVWRSVASHMVRSNVDQSLAAIRAGYNMSRTRIKVDNQVVAEPRRQ
jgi:hypothetical protein